MKKILLLLLILLSCQIFAWEKIEILDEFQDPTGSIRITQNNKNQNEDIVYIDAIYKDNDKNFKKNYLLGFISWQEIKGTNNQCEIKIKIDSNKPITLKGIMASKQIIASLLPEELLLQMKEGKVMKVLIPKETGEKTLSKYDLSNFSEYIKLVQ